MWIYFVGRWLPDMGVHRSLPGTRYSYEDHCSPLHSSLDHTVMTLTPLALFAVLSIGRTLERTRSKAHAAGWVQALLDGMQSGFITEIDGEPVREVVEQVKCVQEVMC